MEAVAAFFEKRPGVGRGPGVLQEQYSQRREIDRDLGIDCTVRFFTLDYAGSDSNRSPIQYDYASFSEVQEAQEKRLADPRWAELNQALAQAGLTVTFSGIATDQTPEGLGYLAVGTNTRRLRWVLQRLLWAQSDVFTDGKVMSATVRLADARFREQIDNNGQVRSLVVRQPAGNGRLIDLLRPGIGALDGTAAIGSPVFWGHPTIDWGVGATLVAIC